MTTDLTARQRWRADVDRYRAYRPTMKGPLKRLRIILLTESIWAIGMYRFGQYLYFEAPSAVRTLLRIPYEIAHKALADLRIVGSMHESRLIVGEEGTGCLLYTSPSPRDS